MKALCDVSGLPYSELLVLNISNPAINSEELLYWGEKANAVLIGGWGESGFEAKTKEKRALLNNAMRKTAPLINYLSEEDKPTLGMCFGHQLLAYMLGGVVGIVKEESETGVTKLQLTQEGRADRIFDGMSRDFAAVVGHKASVASLPEGAQLLVTNSTSPNQAFKMGENMYGTQFHPELTYQGLQERLELFPEYRENENVYEADVSVDADRILKNFFTNVVT